MYRIGIDVGGTFIDFVITDERQTVKLYKRMSDPQDLAAAVISGLNLAAIEENISLSDLLAQTAVIVHGSTIATNALLTRNVAKTALLTTRGFRDVLSMRRGLRQNQFDPRQNQPVPLVPRHLRFSVPERINCEGEEIEPVGAEQINGVISKVADTGVDAVAIALMFSFINDQHEKQVAALVRQTLPDVHISLSSEVLPQVRLYERVSTTVVNACTSPILGTYLAALEKGLNEGGFAGRLLVMQSNGGVMSPEIAKKHGARSLLSGPAAGPVAGLWYAGLHGISRIITIDMGGTSFDVCLIKNGVPEITTEMELGGCRVALPMVAVHTIGAGGGSIVHVNSRGLLQVGPQSAGAFPGPVCYGRGGHQPTVTDADLVLGILDPDFFWGGRLRLNEDAARKTIAEEVAFPLKMGIEEAAYGVYKVVNANMVDAIREVSVRRGYDPREFILVVAGGAGPVHAGALAKELEIPLVIVPRNAAVFCAMGQLLSDLRHDFVRSYVTPLATVGFGRVNDLYGAMKAEALAILSFEKVPSNRIVFSYSADLRYVGQFNEIEVSVQDNLWTRETLQDVAQDFRKRHEALNGYALDAVPLEIVNLRLCAWGITDKPTAADTSTCSVNGSLAVKGSRKVFIDKAFMDVPVYNGSKLGWTSLIMGPSIIEEQCTTLLVPTGYHVSCDRFGNYLMCSNDRKAEGVLEALRERQ